MTIPGFVSSLTLQRDRRQLKDFGGDCVSQRKSPARGGTLREQPLASVVVVLTTFAAGLDRNFRMTFLALVRHIPAHYHIRAHYPAGFHGALAIFLTDCLIRDGFF
jgi:hypothetical protein